MRELKGSCHCGKVRFTVQTHTPQAYMRCYCGICRKTAGGGGYAINLMGVADSLQVTGHEHISIYQPRGTISVGEGESPGRRHFCKHCGSALYISDPRWPELVHPFASAIDSPLPRPPESKHIMLAFKPDWVEVPDVEEDRCHAGYPPESIEDWHKARGLWEE